MSDKTRKRLRWLRYAGLLLLAGLILYAGPMKMLRVLREADPRWLLVGFILNLPQLGLKAYRWSLLVQWQKIPFTYPRAFLAYFSSLLVGFLTPGRLGEMAKAFTLKYEAGVSLAKGLSSVVLDRVFDMYLLLTLGVLGVFRFTLIGERISPGVFVGVCILLALPLLFLNPRVARGTGKLAAHLPYLRSHGEFIQEKTDQFAEGLGVLSPSRILQCAGLTIAAYSIFFLQCYCCSWALGFSPPLLDLVMLMAATNFISFIPLSISGLGTRELCLIYFLARVQPPQPEAVAVLFGLCLFLVLFAGGGIIGFICWQWAPIGLRQGWKDMKKSRETTVPTLDKESTGS